MCDVYLHIYDMSKRIARDISELLLGRKIEGIWHTGIVVYGVEWYFGNLGITNTPPVRD
jgi:desumoylating isopeptidase 1